MDRIPFYRGFHGDYMFTDPRDGRGVSTGLEELDVLRTKEEPSKEDLARIAALQEFPQNPVAAEYAELEGLPEIFQTLDKLIRGKQETVLTSARTTQALAGNDDRYKTSFPMAQRMGEIKFFREALFLNSDDFLKAMQDFLKFRPVQQVLFDEQFKDLLFERYSSLGIIAYDMPYYREREEKFCTGTFFDETTQRYLSKLATNDDLMAILKSAEDSRTRILGQSIDVRRKDQPKKLNDSWARTTYVDWWKDSKPELSTETSFTVTHGGGFRFLKKVFSGILDGYQLEHQGDNRGHVTGLQVHPYYVRNDRILHYGKKSLARFDSAAVLTFDIKAQWLDWQSNWYEAGVRTEFFTHGKNFCLENVVTGERIYGETLEEFKKNILKLKTGIGEL